MRPLLTFICVVVLSGCHGEPKAAGAKAPAGTLPKPATSTAAAAGPVRDDERPLLTNTNTQGQPEAGPPVENTEHATETAPVAVTGTHLARKP